MKRFTICTASVFLIALGLAACEESAGTRGNPVDEANVIAPPQNDPSISISGEE